MTSYKTFFIPSTQIIEKKMDKHMGFKVDGLVLKTELQALLSEYEQKGFEFVSMQPVTSTNSNFTYTEGLLVVLKQKSNDS